MILQHNYKNKLSNLLKVMENSYSIKLKIMELKYFMINNFMENLLQNMNFIEI